jgi:hypothetical protein
MLNESAEKFQGTLVWRKVINVHGEFAIGLKRTSEQRKHFFPQTFARKLCAHRPPIAVRFL